MDFISLDFETANARQQPCSIGLVLVINNQIKEEYHTLIKPKYAFSSHCVAVHGITAKDVISSPPFPIVWDEIKRYFTKYPIVAHSAGFDKHVLERVIKLYGLHLAPTVYYDTMALYKYNYPQASSYDLNSVCSALGISNPEHHNALNDARCVASIMLKMLDADSCCIFPSFLGSEIVGDEKDENIENKIAQELEIVKTSVVMCDDSDIVFDGSVFVLTGVFVGRGKDELKSEIEARGGKVIGSVSKKVNYVVTGLQDLSVVKDKEGAKSRKLIDAERLRDEGHGVKIINAELLNSALSK